MAVIETYRPALRTPSGINPKKFTLWLFLVTVTMMFAAFSSALVVQLPDAQANGTWVPFNVPSAFAISTILIVLSSASMQWAYVAAKRNELEQNKIALLITLLLGMGFLYSQVIGYKALMTENVYFTGLVKAGSRMVSPISASFFYMITGIDR